MTSLILSFALSVDAHAYTPRALGGCAEIAWDVQPDVVLHTSEAVGVDFVELLQLVDAMIELHDAVGDVGASSAGIRNFTTSTEPFVYQSWFGDAYPTIHVGFTSDPSAAIGSTFWDADAACVLQEAHIQLQDDLLVPWLFAEPGLEGYDWWDVEHSLSSTWWFRISYLHELIHAFGAAHSNSSYSMMNYGDRPFANRASGEQLMPLPDDVEFFRDQYPAAGSRSEVAVLNTWYEAIVSADTYPAANQYRLCQPAKGASWAADDAEGFCAVGGTNQVCPGDTVRLRFAAANYSTSSVDLTARMVLSTDTTLGGGDLRSPTLRTFTLGAQSSSKQGRTFTVPTSAAYGAEYNVLVRVGGTTTGGVAVSDWSPMRGTLQIKRRSACP
jgi:hypothetical protein